ncbi:MAG: hypothetical protein H9W81_09805 [Enterococcus sp.]|nr:hypothetical protein [Enterococcus sp.]
MRENLPHLLEFFDASEDSDSTEYLQLLTFYYTYYFLVVGSDQETPQVKLSEEDIVVEGDRAKILNNKVYTYMDGEDVTRYREMDDPGYTINLKKTDGKWGIVLLDVDLDSLNM